MTPTPRLGIAINLDELRESMTDYIDEVLPKDEQLLESMRFSKFLLWLSKRQQPQQSQLVRRDDNDGQRDN